MESIKFTNRFRTVVVVFALNVAVGGTYAGWKILPECLRYELAGPIRTVRGLCSYLSGGDYEDKTESDKLCR